MHAAEVLKKGKKEVTQGLTDFQNQIKMWLKMTETRVLDNSQKQIKKVKKEIKVAETKIF